MTPYRFLVESLAGTGREEIPLEDVKFGRQLNAVSSASGTLPLSLIDRRTSDELISSSLIDPGRTVLYVERGGLIVWGGLIWAVQADITGNTLNIAARDWLSYFERRFNRKTYTADSVEQFDIAEDLIDNAQADNGGDLDLTVTKLPSGGSGVMRDRTYFGHERKQVLEAIAELAAVQNGFDFEAQTVGTLGSLTRRLLLAYPRLGADTSLVFEVGKNVQVLEYSLDASEMANRIVTVGSGDGVQMLVDEQTDTAVLANTLLLERVEQHKDVKQAPTLATWGQAYLKRYKRGERTCRVRIVEDGDTPYGSYAPGDRVRVRASYGYLDIDETWRIMGFDVGVDSNGAETVEVDLAPLEAFTI